MIDLPRTVRQPLAKLTFSWPQGIPYQLALQRAGMMNFGQTSHSLNDLLSKASRILRNGCLQCPQPSPAEPSCPYPNR